MNAFKAGREEKARARLHLTTRGDAARAEAVVNARHTTRSPILESAYKRSTLALHRYLMRRLSTTEGARDLAQEVYVRLMRVRHEELIRCPQAYLFRIASNVASDWQRRRQRDIVTFDSNTADAAEDTSDTQAIEPSDRLNAERQLEHVLAQLPPLYAAILVMRKRDGMSLEEIAKELSISIHTAKKYLFQAVAQARAADWGDWR